MAGISSKALKSPYAENRKGFNGNELQKKEFSDGSSLEEYDFNARQYDQQIGRFLQMDPMSDESIELSPYAFASDNPILRNDPSGLRDTVVNGELRSTSNPLKEVVVVGHKSNKPKSSTISLDDLLFGGIPLTPSIPGVGAAPWLRAIPGVGALVSAGLILDQLVRRLVEKRWFITYYKVGPGGKIYVGRCSGFGNSVEEVLGRYDLSHRMNQLGYGPARMDQAMNGSVFASPYTPAMGSNRLAMTEISGYAATRG